MFTRSTARRRGPLQVAAAVAIVIVLAACSSAASAPNEAPQAAKPASGVGGDAFATAGPAQPAASGGSLSGSTSGAADNYIVRTGSISIEVPKIEPALLQVRTAIAGLGGYISDSDQSNQSDTTIASVTYRIPVAHWQDALDAIRGIATKVDSAKSTAVEVTGQVLDLGARIDNLRTTELALQAIMARATKISDVLDVESKLSEVQGQIEQLTTQQNHLKDQASMATLSVLFGLPPTQAVTQTSRGWDPAAQLDQASAALLGIGQSVASAGIWLFVVGLPIAIVALILLSLALFVGRRLRRSRPSTAVVVPPTEG